MPEGFIPPPEVVRLELARSACETRRLRELLKVSVRVQEDREALARYERPKAPALSFAN